MYLSNGLSFFERCSLITATVYANKPWSSRYIISIHKNNDITDPNNYRGITVANAIGKLFNKVLNIRLDKFLEKYHIINDCQIRPYVFT